MARDVPIPTGDAFWPIFIVGVGWSEPESGGLGRSRVVCLEQHPAHLLLAESPLLSVASLRSRRPSSQTSAGPKNAGQELTPAGSNCHLWNLRELRWTAPGGIESKRPKGRFDPAGFAASRLVPKRCAFCRTGGFVHTSLTATNEKGPFRGLSLVAVHAVCRYLISGVFPVHGKFTGIFSILAARKPAQAPASQ